jgi:hypothetical protein
MSHPVFAPKAGYVSTTMHKGVRSGGAMKVPRAHRTDRAYWRCLVAAASLLFVTAAQGQSNLDAGKSPAQIFSDTCNACHRSPREVRRTSPAFLREHYTTGTREAAAMAAYLASVGSDARAVQQRKPPVLGAGRTPAAENSGTKPTAAQAGSETATGAVSAAVHGRAPEGSAPEQTAVALPKLRRPSNSLEIGISSVPAPVARRSEQSVFPTFEE